MTGKVRFDCARYNESTGLFQYTPVWRNFIHEVTFEDRTQALTKYNARQTELGNHDWYVEFDSEEDLILFIMRWS